LIVVESTDLDEKREKGRWKDLDYLLFRNSPFACKSEDKNFEEVVGETVKSVLHEVIKVLIIGAGGLGCDLLKKFSIIWF